MISQRISHYQIIKKLGSGGMGEVYLAEDSTLGRMVALKVLPAEVATDPARLRRFVHEARAASALKHANIAGIYELGEADGVQFIVMELVEGETLESLMKGHPTDTPQILDVALQVADALEEAHSKGVIHRDIKPANIMITQKGQVKVLDFGLAKMMLPSSSQSDFSKIGTQTGTEPGLVLGTVQYMSPEQALGKPVDHRTDLFSVGIVLYQMATGRLPFAGESTTETINRIVHNAPDAIARFNYSCPPELEHIVRKCLEKDPERRYQSAHELLIDLKNLKRDTESGVTQMSVRPAPQRKRKLWPMLAIGMFLIVVGAFLFFLRANRNEKETASSIVSETSKRKMIAVLPFQNLGASDDQFFAEGMTDEITSRLATVQDLGVISRSSAMQYQKTDKNTKQIGQELNVDYLLEGTIRWSRSGDISRVRVTPQLIRVADDTQIWSDIYDHVLSDIFQVQSEIAQGVIAQLGIKLAESQQKSLSSAPTNNLEAYQAYLRGNEAFYAPSYDEARTRNAIDSYERAVQLDPTFADAYARLARAQLILFHEGYDPSERRLELAKEAVDKALALKPDLPAAYVALGYYHYHGFRDYAKALEAFSAAAKVSPNDSDVLSAIAFVERRQGKFEDSVQHLKKVLDLDPRVADFPIELGTTLTRMRRYAEADRYYDRSLQLAPDQVYGYAMKRESLILWKGDLKAARVILEKMPKKELSFYHKAWIRQEILERKFHEALNRLETVPVEVFQEESVYLPKILVRASLYDRLQEKQKALDDYNRSIQFLEAKLTERAEDPAFHSALGIAYAGAGRKQDAIREGKLAAELLPVSNDAFMGPKYVANLANIYIMTGQLDQALEQIEYLLSISAWFSISLLQVDPVYDPLRNHPRYRQIIAKFS